MDCEKFESALMDELYGELDELTSAATRRHVEGCARCAALIGGLRATRRVAALPIVAPPENLERRVLAAAAAAKAKDVPFRGRLARAVSLAGSWAMRPQTAMAAVFLVMIGTSVLLLRGKSSRAPASAYVTVTEEGTPAPAVSSAAAVPSPRADPAPQSAPLAANRVAEHIGSGVPSTTLGAPAGWAQPPVGATLDEPRSADTTRSRSTAKPAKAEDALGAGMENLPLRTNGGAASESPPSPVAQTATAGRGYASAADGELAPAAPATDPADELWAARAARDAAARQGRQCPSGPKFDDVASRTPGSQTGWDALYEGALCYEGAGQYGNARTRLGTLLGVPSYRDRARATLDRINKEQNGGAARAAAKAASAGASTPNDASH